jgi:type IV pilus assembly protein PilA
MLGMNSKLMRVGWVCLLMAAGCYKENKNAETGPSQPASSGSVQLVPAAEQSRHFEAVSRQLELGGMLYGYVDIDGDALKAAASIKELTDQIVATQPMLGMFLERDYAALFTELGFNDVKAIGFSSVAQAGGGFRNRTFFYTPDGRRGLLAIVGGPPAAFLNPNLAPADTDFYSECEIDLPVAYAAVKHVVAEVGGAPAADVFEAKLKAAGAQAGISALDVIQALKGRMTTVLRLDPEHNVTFPGRVPFTVPAFSVLLGIDGIGPAVEGALAKSPAFASSQEGTIHFYTATGPSPIEGVQPVVAIDGSTLYVSTTKQFLDECLHRKTGLDQDPEFERVLAAVGPEGNGLTYISPHFFARLHQLGELNPQLALEQKQVLNMVLQKLPLSEQVLISVRINQPDGILVRSYWDRSLKQDLAMIGCYNPVTVGLLAAMAIPAFNKVRATSQQKAITNNLRQFAAGGQQYMLDKGVDHATYSDIVGTEPDKYVRPLVPVAGEDYTHLVLHATDTVLSVTTADGRVIEFRL